MGDDHMSAVSEQDGWIRRGQGWEGNERVATGVLYTSQTEEFVQSQTASCVSELDEDRRTCRICRGVLSISKW